MIVPADLLDAGDGLNYDRFDLNGSDTRALDAPAPVTERSTIVDASASRETARRPFDYGRVWKLDTVRRRGRSRERARPSQGSPPGQQAAVGLQW